MEEHDQNHPGSESRPRVSVGLPVYNGGRYLVESIGSLLDQTFQDFELIISDNGSTDETRTICEGFAAQDPRIRYIRHEINRGASWNFNIVFELARAPYFKWASHDDLHAPTFLERCVHTMDTSDGDVILCYPKTIEIDADGREVGGFEDQLDLRSDDPADRFKQLLRRYRLSNPIFGLLRTDMVRSTRLLSAYPSSDLVLFAELALRGKFVEIPERLFLRRIHPGRSVESNKTMEEVAIWFDPNNAGRRIYPRTKLLIEHARAVALSPISLTKKLRSSWYLVRYYRYWPFVRGEAKHAALTLFGHRG